MLTSAFFGGLGGNLFQAAGKGVNSAFKSKSRKEYENSIGKYYTEVVKNDAKQVSLMMQHLNNADQEGMVQARESIVNEMMLNLTSKALEAGKFDQFHETLEQISGMSEEDKKSFLETTGTEFNSDLAEQYKPEILRKSLEMRDKYLKHRNNFGPQVSSRLSRIELENSGLESMINKKRKDIEDVRSQMGESWNVKGSDRLKTRLDRKENGTVLRRRKKALDKELRAEVSEVKKGFIQKAIDVNELKLKAHNKATNQATKDKKNLDAVAKEKMENQAPDDKIAETAYNAHKEQIIAAKEIQAQAEERILMNNEDMIYSKSEDGQNRVKVEKVRQDLAGANSIEELNSQLEAIDGHDFMDNSEKTEVKSQIQAKITELETQEKEADSKRKAEEVERNKIRQAQKNNENPETADNDNRTPIGDVVEDENFDDEPDFSKEQLNNSEKVLKSKIGDGYIALLDKVNRNGVSQTPGYDTWMENPIDKTGKVFRYTVSVRNENLSKAQNDAIQAFENATDASSLSQEVYDNLPITATLKGHDKIFTFLPTKPNANSLDQERIREYNNGYAEQRVLIITQLKQGKTVEVKVAKGSGGGIKSTYDQENKVVQKNSILDLKQIGNKLNNVELLVSNKDGYLMDTYKVIDKDLGNRAMLFANDKDGNKAPYKGGVFLKVKKANGQPFALKLNFLNNTRKNSELLTELLIKIAVPAPMVGPDGKAIMEEGEDGKKKLKLQPKSVAMSATVSELDEGLRADIEEHMGPELAMLDPKYKNPKIFDLINSFIYVSEETKGKTSSLYMLGNDLHFGGIKTEAGRISPGYRNNADLQERLVDFIHKRKKRQFNIKMWNESEAYRQYVLENKIINTDAPTEGPIFTNTRGRLRTGEMTGRRIQLYMEPVGGRKTPNKPKFKKGQKFSMKDLGIRSVADPDAVDNTPSTSTSPSKQPTQQTSDTQIRKDDKDKVSLPKQKVSQTFINFPSDGNKSAKPKKKKPKMGRKRPKQLDDSDSGKAKKEPICKKGK